MVTITTSKLPGPCVGAQPTAAQTQASPGVSWDLDNGDLLSWTRALQGCQACPVRDLCAQERDEMFEGAGRPAGVIWAGVAYSDTGKPLNAAGLRRLAAAHRGRRVRAGSTAWSAA